MGIGCGGCFAKYLLCLFNFVLFLAGASILAVGAWLHLDKKSFFELIRLAEAETHSEISTFTEPLVFSRLSYILLATGALIFFVGFLGYCGALKESRCLLGFYGILLVLILILEITAVGLAIAYRYKLDTETMQLLKSTLDNHYTTQRNKTDSVTMMWNLLMAEMSCCGVNNFEDFNQIFKDEGSTQKIPVACCVLEGDIRKFTPKSPNCTQEPSSVNSYYMTGCYKTLLNWGLDHVNIVIWVVLGIIFIELLTVFLSFCLCKSLKMYDDDDDKM